MVHRSGQFLYSDILDSINQEMVAVKTFENIWWGISFRLPLSNTTRSDILHYNNFQVQKSNQSCFLGAKPQNLHQFYVGRLAHIQYFALYVHLFCVFVFQLTKLRNE